MLLSTKNNLRILNQAAFDEEPEADDLIRFPVNEEIGDININDTNVNDVNVNEGNTDDVNDGISNDLNNFNTNDVNCDVNRVTVLINCSGAVTNGATNGLALTRHG